MGPERTTAIPVTTRLALLIAMELERLAVQRGLAVRFDVSDLQAIAERVVEVVGQTRPSAGLVDAQTLSQELGVARDWVYANAERLGAVRLGNGPRARLRFDLEQARKALTAPAGPVPSRDAPKPRRRGRPRRRAAGPGVTLIQGRANR